MVLGGIVTCFRRVITKANATMGVATLEDLQGSIEVVVFPRLYEQTAPIWQEGTILLVAGRVDHRGEEVSLLADIVKPWEDAAAIGPGTVTVIGVIGSMVLFGVKPSRPIVIGIGGLLLGALLMLAAMVSHRGFFHRRPELLPDYGPVADHGPLGPPQLAP